MGVISGSNTTKFKSTKYIFSEVKRFLSSYNAANLLDEGEFPTYVKKVLGDFEQGVYMESQAVIPVENFKAKLPENFKYVYVAYKCSPLDQSFKAAKKHKQHNSSFAFVTDITDQIIETTNDCEISCCDNNRKIIEEIRVEQYVMEEKNNLQRFGNVVPLRLSPNVDRDICVDGGINFLNNSAYEVTFKDGYIHTNFDDDSIYMKYYAFPMDTEGNIMIPDIQSIEDTIKWYIVYQVLLSAWFNNTIPDIQGKWQKAEQLYLSANSNARYYTKLPSFAEMVNSIRNKRSQNPLVFVTSQYSNTNFQRSR